MELSDENQKVPLSPLDAQQERLVLSHMVTARTIAEHLYNKAPHALELEELISIGYTGLTMAARAWPDYCLREGYSRKDEHGFYFYSRKRIKGAILDAFRVSDWATRALRFNSRKLRDAGQDNGATVQEMSDLSGLSPIEITKTINDMTRRKPLYLEDEEVEVGVIESTESSILVNSLLSVAVEVIKSLDLIQQVILVLHYYSRKELQVISKILGIAGVRVSRLHTEGVIQVKNALALEARGASWRGTMEP